MFGEVSESTPVTQLLLDWNSGNTAVRGQLMSALYPEMRRLAHFHLNDQEGRHTLQATELLHEAYFRIVDQRSADWRGKAHFMAIASRIMRRVLLDRAKRRMREKRGGGAINVSLAGIDLALAGERVDILILDKALAEMEAKDPVAAQVVEMRFFSGLTYDEVAAALGLGRATVSRRWRFARAWLYRYLS